VDLDDTQKAPPGYNLKAFPLLPSCQAVRFTYRPMSNLVTSFVHQILLYWPHQEECGDRTACHTCKRWEDI